MTVRAHRRFQLLHLFREKGIQVNRTERNLPKPTPRTVLLAKSGVLRDGEGSLVGSLSSRSRGYRLTASAFGCVFVLALALTCGAVSAFASAAPPSLQFNTGTAGGGLKHYGDYGNDVIFVFSTRMFAEAGIFVNGLDSKWRAEYSTSKSALESGSGTVANSGESPYVPNEGAETLQFGTPTGQLEPGNGKGFDELHHLVPDTHYYAQFVAENSASDGKPTVLPFEFTTLPAGKPEIANSAESFVGERLLFSGFAPTPTTAQFNALIETNGAATTYSMGYSKSLSGPVTVCATGSISVAEDYAEPVMHCTGLTPETTYYSHLTASNENGTLDGAGGLVSSFTTPTARPIVYEPTVRNVTGVSARVRGGVQPHGEETRWRFESAPSVIGPWTAVPGGEGTVSQAQAEALPEGDQVFSGVTLTGLSPDTSYYVRLYAENTSGEGENSFGEPVSTEVRGLGSFQTAAPPTASTDAVHTLDGESLRIIGAVDPDSTPTSAEQTVTIGGAPDGGTFTLTFNGQTTAPIAYDAPAESVTRALNDLPAKPEVGVEGPVGGPYTVFAGEALFEKAEPEIQASSAGLLPSGTVSVTVDQQGGVGYDAHYHFEYVSQKQFEKSEPGGNGFVEATSTPEVDVGSGTEAKFGAVDLPSLTPGETYLYRIVATSNFPGNPVVDGAVQRLTVPTPPAPEPSTSCPNEALRTGASANLPDCRGYEQLTPVDKEGSREPFTYGLALGAGVAVSPNGEHAMLEAEVSWGSSPASGQAPYFFSREGSGGWRITSAAPQPETGLDHVDPGLFDPELTSFAFDSFFDTSPTSESKEVEYRAGPPGGPYVTVASVPDGEEEGQGWVAASQDFSRLFLSVSDHTLLGYSTGTRQGGDLYEYYNGELSQVNVTGAAPGSTVGTCGATVVKGDEEAGLVSSAHSVSSDGSRVFFEAVPGGNCSEQKHLYMRVDGESTVDIGAYSFIAANSEGTKLLLEKRTGETHEILLYETETESASLKSLFAVHREYNLKVSEDLSAIYILTSEQLTPEAPSAGASSNGVSSLYRYDVPSEKLSFIDSGPIGLIEVSQEGRYLYFGGAVEGVPAGPASEVYRYDSSEALVQCISCASPFDPEPKQSALFGATGGGGGMLPSRTGYPKSEVASSDGDYVFFDTTAALVAADVDGEVAPSSSSEDSEQPSQSFSVSSDVYEWRKDGVGGCAHLQGCLALITNGRGGFMNLFLGTDESGQDAFIYTNSQLGPRDDDSAGDIYDARIDGGEPTPAPRPVECEGDACSTPLGPPDDTTPSSFTFSGAGNVLSSPSPKPAVKSKKPKPKKKTKHEKAKQKPKSKGKKASGRRGKTTKSSRRSK
jgi:hypothetical protein